MLNELMKKKILLFKNNSNVQIKLMSVHINEQTN